MLDDVYSRFVGGLTTLVAQATSEPLDVAHRRELRALVRAARQALRTEPRIAQTTLDRLSSTLQTAMELVGAGKSRDK